MEFGLAMVVLMRSGTGDEEEEDEGLRRRERERKAHDLSGPPPYRPERGKEGMGEEDGADFCGESGKRITTC